MPRSHHKKKPPACYGVEIIYPNDPNYAVIARKDAELLRAVQRVVPRIHELPDSGFGPAGRDLSFDAISYGKGFTLTRRTASRRWPRPAG
jgi:hypothetical protein